MAVSREKARTRLGEALAPLLLFLFGLVLYLPSLPTTVSFEDSAEFVAAAATGGILHPSGYPLYVLLARAFAALPVATPAWRVAFFSAVCASAALAVLFLVARRLAGTARPLRLMEQAVVALLIAQLGVSTLWWSQAIYAKAYPLHVLLLALAAWSFARWLQNDGRKWLIAAGAFVGLSLANHLFLTIAALPAFAIAFVMFAGRKRSAWLAGAYAAAVSIAVAALPYVWLAWRAGRAPAYAFTGIDSPAAMVGHVLRLGYADAGAAGWNKAGLASAILGASAGMLGPIVGALFVTGLFIVAVRWRKTERARLALEACCVMLAFSPLAVIAGRAFGWSVENEYIYRVYAFHGAAFAAVFAAVGAVALLRRLPAPAPAALVASLAGLPLVSALLAWPHVALFREPLVDAYARAMLEPLPPRAVLVVLDEGVTNDTELFALAYLQSVENVRRDVTVVTDTDIRPLYRPDLPSGHGRFPLLLRRRMLLESAAEDESLSGRPVFASFPSEAVSPSLPSRSNGVVYSLGSHAVPVVEFVPPPSGLLAPNFALSSIASHLHYARAAALVDRAGPRAGLFTLIDAIALDPFPQSDDFAAFVAHRARLLAPAAEPCTDGDGSCSL